MASGLVVPYGRESLIAIRHRGDRTLRSTVGLGVLLGGLFGLLATIAAARGLFVMAAGFGGASVGALACMTASTATLRHQIAGIRTMTRALAAGGVEIAAPGRMGALAPVADDLAEIAQAFEATRLAATQDRLTRVDNRPTVLANLFGEVERAGRYGRPLAVMFIDIDHFKAVNDTYGHEVGDRVLRVVADVLRENVRATDRVGRYGGEEFVVILPETPVDEAAQVAEKLRTLILKHRASTGGEDIGVSVSIGVAGGHGSRIRVDELLRDADAAMYSAKSLGRNQTYVFAETDDDTARIPRAPLSAAGRARAAEVGELGRQAAEAALAAIVAPLPTHRGKPSSMIGSIAVEMARELQLPDSEIERIRLAALLHDIGKVGVPGEILDKPGELTADEWQVVVQHPRIGQAIITQVAAIQDAGAIILHHHERFSGHGYPHGLRAHDIPLGARIVSIADAYEAMTHDRPYRRSIGHRAAIQELQRHAGVQFDPELVDLFRRLYDKQAPTADESLLAVGPVPIGRVRTPSRRHSRSASA